MARIVVIPEHLQRVSSNLKVNSENIYALATQLRGAANCLDWEVHASTNIDGRVNAACKRARDVATQLMELSQFLAIKAQAFEDVDMSCAANLSTFFAKHPVVEIGADQRSIIDRIKDLDIGMEDIRRLGVGGILATLVGWSSKRPNSVTIGGSNNLLKIVGWDGTRVIIPTNFSDKLTGFSAYGDVMGGLGTGIGSIIDPENIQAGNSVAAGAIDALMKIMLGLSGTALIWGATYAVGALAAALVAAGVAPIVIPIAGGIQIISWVFGGFAYDKLVESPAWQQFLDSQRRQDLIESTDQFIDQHFPLLDFLIQQGYEIVTNAFGPYINALLSIQ